MDVVRKFKTPGSAVSARVRDNLQEARNAPFFFEYFFGFCQKSIPFGDGYEARRHDIDGRMHAATRFEDSARTRRGADPGRNDPDPGWDPRRPRPRPGKVPAI